MNSFNESHVIGLIKRVFSSINRFFEKSGSEDCVTEKKYLDILEYIRLSPEEKSLYDVKSSDHLYENIKNCYQQHLTTGTFNNHLPDILDLNEIYEYLEDDISKITFDWMIGFRIAWIITDSLSMAEKIFPYPNRRKELFFIKKFYEKINDLGNLLFRINNYDIQLKSVQDIYFLNETWIYENYMFDSMCSPQKGDVVIDAGAYIGDSSIWFAQKVTWSGKVYAFEMDQANAEYLNKNIIKNQLDGIVKIQNNGLWDSKTKLFAKRNEFASSCCECEGDFKFEAISLDLFVKKEKLQRIDFIKMDIEGAEIMALNGSKSIIKKFKPKLAIAVYHKSRDIIEIPKLLKCFVPEYKICLSHKLNMPVDTLIFARI